MSSSDPVQSGHDACSFSAFVARVGGDVDLAREMAGIFLADADRLMLAVRTAVDHQCANEVRTAAHALKGAAANFDAARVVRAASALETMGATGDLATAIAAVQTIEAEFVRMIRELRKAIEDGAPCVS